MAEFIGQSVPMALVARAIKGKPGMAIIKPCAAGPGPVLVVQVPAGWPEYPANGLYVGPLVAQVLLARGGAAELGGTAANIATYRLVSTAGNQFVFSSPASLEMWAAINRARVLRELELAAGMAPEKLAVWVAAKREKLAKYTARLVASAARVEVGAVQQALIEEAEFAALKWAHL